MSKLEEVTEKICELLYNTDLCVRKQVDNKWQIYIGEAEILTALNSTDVDYAMESDGTITSTEEMSCEYTFHTHCQWSLGKPLSEQLSETINFLYEILVS